MPCVLVNSGWDELHTSDILMVMPYQSRNLGFSLGDCVELSRIEVSSIHLARANSFSQLNRRVSLVRCLALQEHL